MNVSSSRRKKVSTILILAAILVMPGFLYYLLQEKGKNRYHPLAVYGPKQVAPTFHTVRGKKVPDTIYHKVSDFSLVNQSGDSLSLASWRGKVIVLNLFYTKADSDGVTTIINAMQGFNKMYQKNRMVHLVSLSVDPKDDTSSLASFANKIEANLQNWDFVYGKEDVVHSLIRQSLLLDVLTENSSATQPKFVYSNKIVLLDTQHRIRGFYEATNQEALSKLDDEIKVQIAEELRNMRDGR